MMKIYCIKIALHGISTMVWRRLQIPENTSLARLHQIIQIANQWDDDYLHQFHIFGKDYDISYRGGLAFSDDPYQVYLNDFGFDKGDKFTYEYNFFEHCLVDLRIEDITESSSQSAVVCINGNGMPGENKQTEIGATLELIRVIAHADKKTTMGDIRPFVEALNAVRFNRLHINHELKTELTD